STIFDFLFFFLYQHFAPSHLQVMWFLASVCTELLLIFSLRSSRWFFQTVAPPKALWITTFVAAGLAFLVATTEPLMTWFSFPRPTLPLLALTGGLVVVYFLCTDVAKRLYLRWLEPKFS
nr:cation transporting ATPase C-terminal domain-containing protein [Patescibacteria group bacterium]